MLKSTLTTWGDGVFESIRSIPRDWNEFHILWTTSVSVMVNLSSDRKQHSVSPVFAATTLFHSDTSLTDLEPISLCTSSAEQKGTAPSQSLQSMWRLLSEFMVLNLCQWRFSVWGPGLTGQSMAQQSFGAFEPIEFWDSSGVCEKEKHRQQEKERQAVREKCTFPFQEKQMRANNNRG